MLHQTWNLTVNPRRLGRMADAPTYVSALAASFAPSWVLACAPKFRSQNCPKSL